MLHGNGRIVHPHALFVPIGVHFEHLYAFLVHLETLVAREHLCEIQVLPPLSVGIELN